MATVRELQQTAEFTAIAQAAMNDDRAAFDRLWVWADDNQYPL
jgi:hypothetical protein